MSGLVGNPLFFSTSSAQYQIERSLRFNSADSAYLSRTPASAGNRKTWTWAGWVKRSAIGTQEGLFSAGTSLTNDASFGFSAGIIECFNRESSTINMRLQTTPVFRDFSAWYHIVFVWNTTSATASDRAQIWVNGVRITAFNLATYPGQNTDSIINNNVVTYIGTQTLVNYSNSYLADIHFIDGQALTPTSFGEFDANNVWQPKAYTGSYGTNGFKLNFSNNSAATAAALGADSSGNGNHWTPTNLSVTAGAGNDSLVDSPTSYGTDTGAGGEVRGNYCTWNPLLRGQTGTPVYSNGNLDASATGNWAAVGGTVGIESGKWYWETTLTAAGSSNQSCIGLLKTVPTFFLGFDSGSWGYFSNGNKYTGGTASAYGSSYTANDVIGVAFDRDNGTLVFYKNGVSQGTAYTGLTSGIYFPATSHVDSSTSATNFGQRPFAYTAPSGFKALCTANLPTPTIANPATAMDVKLITANNSTQVITGLAFSPDLVWTKSRSNAYSHYLYDTVRGVQKPLISNATNAEATIPTSLTSFNSDGFTLGADDGANYGSGSGVAWTWDAGSSTVTNTSGSISSQVRANTSAGFSIVTYTGTRTSNGTDTIGHGLGVAPELILIKRRDGATEWHVKHKSLTSWQYALILNSTGAQYQVNTTYGTMTAPSSTVFSTSYTSDQNVNGYTYVAYCFAPVAGYSAFGSYTGNGNADGPFVYTGFRPRWVLIKITSSTGDWIIWDTARNTSNTMAKLLFPNDPGAELDNASYNIDCLSNGFKIRAAGGSYNSSAATYIYAAFAEHPFSASRAR